MVVLYCEASAGSLAVSGREVEEGVAASALPGHHVEEGRLDPAEAAPVVDVPRAQHLYSEGVHPVDCFGCELPLVLVATIPAGGLEGGKPHDEVVNKLLRYLEEPSLHIIVPF